MTRPILLFDWGNTLMVDFGYPGPMYRWEKVAWVPYAHAALEELYFEYPCYIATNAGLSDEEAVRKALRRLDAERYFRGVFTSTDLGFEKPDPRFFHEICRRLNAEPSACVMIGDIYRKDVVGARVCGIQTVWYNRKKEEGIFPDAVRTIFSMHELPDVIRTL